MVAEVRTGSSDSSINIRCHLLDSSDNPQPSRAFVGSGSLKARVLSVKVHLHRAGSSVNVSSMRKSLVRVLLSTCVDARRFQYHD